MSAKFFTRVLLVGFLGILLLFAVEIFASKIVPTGSTAGVSFISSANADGYSYRWHRWYNWNRSYNYQNDYQYDRRYRNFNYGNQSYGNNGPMYYNGDRRYRYWRSF